jgi:hypothetical protein
MLLYTRAQRLLSSINFIQGPRIDLPNPTNFSRDLEDIEVGGNPSDHIMALYSFADFSLQTGVYAGEFGIRIYYRGAYTVLYCSRLYAKFLITSLKLLFNVGCTLTLCALIVQLSTCAWVTAVSLKMGVDLLRFLRLVRRGQQMPGARQCFASAVNSAATHAQRYVIVPAVATVGVVGLVGASRVRARTTVTQSLATIPNYNPNIGLFPPSRPDPTNLYVSTCLSFPCKATVVMGASVSAQLDYRSIKGKKGVKIEVPVNVGPPAPFVQITDTLVHDCRPLVRVEAPFGPWHLDISRFVGESFAQKYFDETKGRITLSTTPGRYAIGWTKYGDVPIPYPVVPTPPLLVVKRGAPVQYMIPDKMLRELDIPKLMSRQTDHDVFLQRLDQASRAIKHEYKDINDRCLERGLIGPGITVPQVVGLNCKLQNERAKLIEDFLRGR